jgi:hypothetical protein
MSDRSRKAPAPRHETGTTGSPVQPSATPARPGWFYRVFDAVFRFLASLKLAVISLSLLAGVLAYATFYEKSHGTSAVQEEIYRNPAFAVLLAFLGMNILCAALIRFPWTRRQTGFVITHAGLLVVLLGSWISFNVTEDGQVGMVEGDRSDELVRIDFPALWVQPIDAKTGEPKDAVAYKLPFRPGAFSWETGKAAQAAPQARSARATALGIAGCCGLVLGAGLVLWRRGKFAGIHPAWLGAAAGSLGVGTVVPLLIGLSPTGPRRDLLTTGDEPFRLEIRDYFPASTPISYVPKSGTGGVPMIKPQLTITPPGSEEAVDIFDRFDDGSGVVRWFKADNTRLRRAARDLGSVLFTFQYTDNPDLVDDFLTLPDQPLVDDLVRIHYRDQAGKARVLAWPNDRGEGQSLTLPDSDITVKLDGKRSLELDDFIDRGGEMTRATAERVLSFVEFLVKKGDGPEVQYIACSSLPNVPNAPDQKDPIIRVHYYRPPTLGPTAMQGRSSVVDVLATADGKLYYRAFNREGLRGKGPIAPGKTLELVTKSAGQPVTYTLRVEEYLGSGVDDWTCSGIDLPPNQKDAGIPAALVALTVGQGDKAETRETWVRRMHPSHDFRQLFRPVFEFTDANQDGIEDSDGHVPRFETLKFANGEAFRVGLDFDRRRLGFQVQLKDFEMGTDPGTQQAASYVSDVLLEDKAAGIEEKPYTISMNEPLTWKDYTFYQANFDRVRDPRGRSTGQFMSIFQVRYDPDWCWGTVYGGCLLVVLGTFVQFYMRAGLFSDGGKKQREREALKRGESLASATGSRNGAGQPVSVGAAEVEDL